MFSSDKMDCPSASHPSTCSESMEMRQKKIDDRLPQKKIDIVSTAKPAALEHCSSDEQKRVRRILKNAPLSKFLNEEDPLPAGFMQSSRAGYDTTAATEPEPEVKVVEEVKFPAKFKFAVKRPLAQCPLCGCKMGNTAHRVRVAVQLDEAYQRCGLCGADEYSFCTRCFIPWTCEIASLAAATEDIYLKPYVNASHVCCCCIAAVPRMTAQDALGTEKPRMTSMTHQQWDHINAVFKYVDEYGFPPVEIVSCRKLEVKLPAADHGYASSKASTLSREDSWTLASTLSTEDSWTLVDE